MTPDFLNSREKQKMVQIVGSYRLAVLLFFFIQNKSGNMKSPLAQGKKVLFARKLTIGVLSAIDFQPIKTCTAL